MTSIDKRAVIWWSYKFLEDRKERSLPVCVGHRHMDPARSVRDWTAIGYTTSSSLVQITSIWTQIGQFLATYDNKFCSINKICQMSSSNEITQDHMLHVFFSIRRIIWFLPWSGILSWSSDQSRIENIWYWLAQRHTTPLQLMSLMKWGTDEDAWIGLPVSVIKA